MRRRVRDGLTGIFWGSFLLGDLLLGGVVLLEPPIASDVSGKWSVDVGRPLAAQIRCDRRLEEDEAPQQNSGQSVAHAPPHDRAF